MSRIRQKRAAEPEAQGYRSPSIVVEPPVSILFAGVLALSTGVRWLIAAGLLAVMGFIDLSTGREVSFSIFYLLPVGFASAFLSRGAGVLFCFLAASAWGYVELTRGPQYSAAWIPYWNTGVRLSFFLLVNELIDQLRRAHQRQQALVREDPLTRIANVRVFREYTQRALDTSRRSGRPFSVAFLDLDRFKQVNDRYGHTTGDAVLQRTAALMAGDLRPNDTVARLGGDEFGILMPDTDDAQARRVIERMVRAIELDVGREWDIGVTVGTITFVQPPVDVDQVVREADALMYRGKSEGRGRILHAQR